MELTYNNKRNFWQGLSFFATVMLVWFKLNHADIFFLKEIVDPSSLSTTVASLAHVEKNSLNN